MENAKATVERLETGGLRAVISTSDLDRDGRIVEQSGWVLDNFKANPVVMWNHDHDGLPVARATNIEVVNGQLVADLDFADFPFAKTVESLYEGGFLSTFSAGWMPVEAPVDREDARYFPKNELIEFSAVPLPSNPSARVLVEAALKGASMETATSPRPIPSPVPNPDPAPPAPTPPGEGASPGESSSASPVTPSQEVPSSTPLAGAAPRQADGEGESPDEATATAPPPPTSEAEAVIPLNEKGINTLAAAISTTGTNIGDLKVYGPGDPSVIADAVMKRMNTEAAELLAARTSAPTEESETAPSGDSGEGSAPVEASGLTTRQHAQRVAEVAAVVTDAVLKRLTGRLPD